MTFQDHGIVIRPAAVSDDWAVHQLFYALHTFNAELDPHFALSDDWERILDEHLNYVRATGHGLTLVAWQGEEPVGLLMMGLHSDTPLFRRRHWAELLAIYIRPDIRTTRLANQLLSLGSKWAQELGYERIQLYVTVSNQRARRFYQRAGFVPVQEIWRRELGPSATPPPDDPIWEAIYLHHQDLLGPNAHHLLVDDDHHADIQSPDVHDPSESAPPPAHTDDTEGQ